MRGRLLGGVAGLLACGAASLTGQGGAPGATGYHVARQIRIGGEGFWDYLALDGVRHRLFLSHGTRVEVVDPDAGTVVGRIPDTPGVHGIALAQDLGRGFVSNGRDGSVTIFDLSTLAPLARVQVTGRNPDAILYDSVTHRVLAFNGASADATALDARTGAVVGTLPLGGKPEYAVADGRGGVFVNIQNRNELAGFDARTLAVRSRWPIPGCEQPTALAYDRAHERLFSGCSNGRLVVLDARDGHAVATLPIGRGVDGGAFDPDQALAFSSSGDGTLTVVREFSPDSFAVVGRVPTRRGARTMTFDPVTHRIYTVTADRAPDIVPGSFALLVVARE